MDTAQLLTFAGIVLSSVGVLALSRFFAARDLKKAEKIANDAAIAAIAKELEDKSNAVAVRKIDEESAIRKELREENKLQQDENKRLVEQGNKLLQAEVLSLKQEFKGCQEREQEMRVKLDEMSVNLMAGVNAGVESNVKISELEVSHKEMKSQILELRAELSASKPATEPSATLTGSVTVEKQEIKVVKE